MIKSFHQLREVLALEKKSYYKKPWYKLRLIDKFIRLSYIQIWKYQRMLRITEYHYNNKDKFIHLILFIFAEERKNRLGCRLGFSIPFNVFDIGLVIDHYGSIVVNGYCKVGKNCRLHGNNCIGNKGFGRENEYPIIGDNVDFGFGSVAIGKITIANNTTIGANAVITHDCLQENTILVGVPAKPKVIKWVMP